LPILRLPIIRELAVLINQDHLLRSSGSSNLPEQGPSLSRSAKLLTSNHQLLLICARLKLVSEQEEAVRFLSNQIRNWNDLIALADRHFVLPLVYQHLKAVQPMGMPEAVLSTMRQRCQLRIMQSMNMLAEQQRLFRDVLLPLGVSHIFFKGPSLAMRYYGGIGLRQCRDIDVLIDPQRLVDVVRTLIDKGYHLDPGHLDERYPQDALTPKDLNAACRYLNVVRVVSPNGVLIELHRLIDSHGFIFRSKALLSKAETCEVDGFQFQVLPTAMLFVYICYHHSRHLWSRLHWIADLDALQRHSSFNLNSTLSLARTSGLESTVKAALNLYQACSQLNPQDVDLPDPESRSMRNACLQIIRGTDLEEKELMKKRSTPDFNFSWQIRLSYACHIIFLHLKPTYADYKAFPLKTQFFPAYYFIRPVRLSWRYLSNLILK